MALHCLVSIVISISLSFPVRNQVGFYSEIKFMIACNYNKRPISENFPKIRMISNFENILENRC